MSEDRLSKLQKWILVLLFESKNNTLWRQRVLYEYCKVKHIPWVRNRWMQGRRVRNKRLNSAEATLTKSIRNLAVKDYIEVAGVKGPVDVTHALDDYPQVNIKFFWLTDKGIAEAKKLLKAKKEKLNFKEKVR